MKLWYAAPSPYVRKVMMAAIECGLEARIEKIQTSVAPVKPNDDLKKGNPLVKIPALETDAGTLYDSRVIVEYLDSLHAGPKLFPAAGPERWTALRRQALADGLLDAAILNRYELALRPAEKQWADWSEGQMRKVRGALDALEAEAGSLAPVGSGPLDIGRIAVGCALGYLDFRYPQEGWRNPRPKLAQWFAGIEQRASYKATKPE